MKTVDAHLHLWDPATGIYSWLTPDLGPIHDRFTAEQARAELDAAGVDLAVLIQAADDPRDTAAMLAVADAHPWVVGVVGWIDLEAPDRAERELDRLGAHPAFCGVRELVHDDPRPDVYGLPAVRATAALLARRGLPLDIPDAFPRDLRAATELAQTVDGLSLVLDHLGKPPRGPGREDEWECWRADFASFAQAPGTVAKISGLACADVPLTRDALRSTVEHALACFGPDRLMLGSDWPITVSTQGYQGTHTVLSALLDDLLGELSTTEQEAIRGGTALRVYRRSEGRPR